MQRHITKRKTAAFAVALLLLGGAGVAYAYWTTGGSGTGTATTRSAPADLTVNQTSTPTDMGPGDSAQTLSGNFDNGGDGPAYVATVTASIASVEDSSGNSIVGCDATDYTLANAAMTVNAQVPVGNGVGSWTGATIKFNNKANANQNACQEATVNLAYAIS